MDQIRELKRASSRLYNRLRQKEDSTIQFTTNVNIERKSIVWNIENIDRSPNVVGEYIESPDFRTGSSEITKWRLRFYPKGNRTQVTSAFYLYKVTPGTKVHVEIKLHTKSLASEAAFSNGGSKMVYEDPTEIGTDKFASCELLQKLKSLELRCEMKVGYLNTSEDCGLSDAEHGVFDCKCSMSADFEKLYNSRQFTDVVLQVGKKQFPVHKAVIAARSGVFFAMFENQMKENATGVVNVEKVEPATMASFLQYIYTGKIEDIDVDKAIRLFEVADTYELLDLQKECSKFLLENMSVDNVCSIAVVADLHCEPKLRDAAAHFICKHSTQVFDKGEWETLASERPTLATNVLKDIVVRYQKDCSKE